MVKSKSTNVSTLGQVSRNGALISSLAVFVPYVKQNMPHGKLGSVVIS